MVPEQYRVKNHRDFATDESDGWNGYFLVPLSGNPARPKLQAVVLISDGLGWKHLSISLVNKKRTPTWEELQKVKEMFFEPDEWVVQFHPPKLEHVNNHDYCLHLWHSLAWPMPVPESFLVGFE